MSDLIRTLVVLGTLLGLSIAFAVGVVRTAHAEPEPEVVTGFEDLADDLDRTAARLYASVGIVGFWAELGARREEATEVACEQLADVAMRREVR